MHKANSCESFKCHKKKKKLTIDFFILLHLIYFIKRQIFICYLFGTIQRKRVGSLIKHVHQCFPNNFYCFIFYKNYYTC